MSKGISAVIISKNEVERIAACIKSLQLVTDDIILIDSGSTDGTIEKARELGAHVFETEWKGFGPTKNFGHTKTKNDWIISLDADEVLSNELANEIKNINLTVGFVFAIDRQNYYQNKRIKYSGWSPDWVYRVFNRNDVHWNDSLVHEKLVIPNHIKITKLKYKIDHYTYRSIEEHKTKIEQYAALRAQIWYDNKKSPGVSKRLFGPVFKGFKSYILKLGFLDGREGWIIAKMHTHLVNRQLYFFDQLKKSTS